MQVAKNTVVTIDYTLTNNDGEVLDSSKGQEPLAYIHGIGYMIPGLENALEGKSEGDSLKVSIEPRDAYGERDESLVKTVDRALFGGIDKLEPGMQFQAQTPEGVEIVTVTAVNGDEVTVDGNHPLADVTLNFDVRVLGVREATAEELEHGHVHGPGGHQH